LETIGKLVTAGGDIHGQNEAGDNAVAIFEQKVGQLRKQNYHVCVALC